MEDSSMSLNRLMDGNYELYACAEARILLLQEMAITNTIPSGEFSDFECELWSKMRSNLHEHGIL